ncbi:unnamed protein product [Sphagnum troendelagicum]|uniref:Uncharacterized protein n=1 Tax=Sphagnum troendelagicum TaxID=128251 RepID=A0ABP0UQG9_9BRYO
MRRRTCLVSVFCVVGIDSSFEGVVPSPASLILLLCQYSSLCFLVFGVCSLQSAALIASVSTRKESTGTLLVLVLPLLCVPYLHHTEGLLRLFPDFYIGRREVLTLGIRQVYS